MSLIQKLRHPVVIRTSIALYILCLCSVIFVYFVISAMQVPTAIYLHGSKDISLNQPLILRGHVIDAQNGRKLGNLHSIKAALKQHDKITPLGSPDVHPSGEMLAIFDIPDAIEPNTDTELLIEIRRAVDAPLFESSTPLNIKQSPENSPTEWPTQQQRRPQKEGASLPKLGAVSSDGVVSIDILESHPVLGTGLPSGVTLRTSHATSGQPLPCDVTFVTTKGIVEESGSPIPATLTTDALGLAHIELTPVTLQSWELEAHCKNPDSKKQNNTPEQGDNTEPLTGSARIQLDVASSQINLQKRTPRTLLPPEQPGELRTNLHSIHKQGPVFVDLYHQHQWMWAGSYGYKNYAGGVSVPIKDTRPGLHRAQIYLDVYHSAFVWDSIYLWRPHTLQGDNTTPLEQAIDELLALHLKHTKNDKNKLFFKHLNGTNPSLWRSASSKSQWQLYHALLQGLPLDFTSSDVLLNSFDEDQRELDAWKKSIRQDLLAVIAAALITGVAMLLLVVMWGIEQAQKRQRLYDEVEAELSDLDDDEAHSPEAMLARQRRARATKLMLWVQGVVLVGTLIVFAACIWMLMRYMM